MVTGQSTHGRPHGGKGWHLPPPGIKKADCEQGNTLKSTLKNLQILINRQNLLIQVQ